MSQLLDVLPAHRLDTMRLTRYLAEHIPGISQMRARQFQGGQSNPTYLLETNVGKLVLRKKPPGTLLPSAHQVEREFRILSALAHSDVPVPKALVLCEDASVLGTAFFVMTHVEGRVFESPALPDVPVSDRREIYLSAAQTLAKLHKVDWRSAGLSDFGRPQNYLQRQIERWTKQYRASLTEADDPRMDQLVGWLEAHRPAKGEVAIAHGDFRIGNLIFAPDEGRVAAVLDWELSTIGDPLGDLGYCCLAYHLPHGMPGVKGLAGLDLTKEGIPSEAEFIATYCRAVGLAGIEYWTFYLVFALFRLAAILQGVHARAIQGNASSTNALAAGRNAALFASIAYDIAQSGPRA